MRFSRIIPSMFQRRLLLLAALGMAGLATPLVQISRLGVVKAEGLRADAEKRLVNEQWLETIRGRILDRKGRVLAMDRPCFDIAVDYPVITGRWAYTQAARRARSQHRSEWAQMSPDQRDALIRSHQVEFDEQLDAMWERFCSIAGISRADLDERRAEIRDLVQGLAVTVTEAKRQRRERQLEERLGKGEEQTVDVATADVRRPIREQSISHILLRGVPESVGFEFGRLVAEDRARLDSDPSAPARMPGVRVVDSAKREYPFDAAELEVDLSTFPAPLRQERKATVRVEGVATHAIGWMRSRLYDEDMQRRPRLRGDGTLDRGHYRPGDIVGQGGIEQGAEETLRGLRGVLTQHLDTGEIERIDPRAGGDVTTTIDAALQARIQALFDPSLGLAIVQPWHKSPTAVPPIGAEELPIATPLNGAIVVIDIASGDILSLVSMPTFTHQQIATEPSLIFSDSERTPYLNRAIDKPYPPGSVVKPLVLAAATSAGKMAVDGRISCTGHFFPNNTNLFRCWIYKQSRNTNTHDMQFDGGLDGSDALMVSCNIYFFELGRRLGPTGIVDCYTRFGIGPAAPRWDLYGPPPALERLPGESAEGHAARQRSVIEARNLLHEHAGSLEREPGKPLTAQEAILMGIGQGPITWTPLHAADAYATLARGGVRITPRLRSDASPHRTDLRLNRAGVSKALDGLRRSANEDRGTTHHLNITMADGQARRERIFTTPGVSIWAKSGTADAPPFKIEADESGEVKYDADHAWCVFLAGVADEPRYAVAVVIERGGSGGRVAGPVGNQVVRALVEEGYLPRADEPVRTDAAVEAEAGPVALEVR